MNRRIILVGPTAGGKTFLRKRFEDRGFTCDVSYTTRSPRPEYNEKDGIHYHFISVESFKERIEHGFFYEWVEYNGNYYGTGQSEWDQLPLFIMETDGIAHIKPEDRASCFVIYLDTPEHERIRRMRIERKWDYPEIQKRIATDKAKFDGFKDYDLRITNPDF